MQPRISKLHRDALIRQDAVFVAAALAPSDPRSTEAHLRHTALLLRDRQTSSPCSRAVVHVTNLFERTLHARNSAAIACAAGCAFCCHQPVAVNGPEALALAARIRLKPEYEGAVLATAASLLAGKVRNMRCPLLAPDNNCSAYAGRPLACHGYVSIDVQDCKTNFEASGSAVVKEPVGYDAVRQHCRLILAAATLAAGLPGTRYELNAVVATALQTDNAEKRWLRGENVFAQVPPFSPFAPSDQRTIDAMAYNIAPTL